MEPSHRFHLPPRGGWYSKKTRDVELVIGGRDLISAGIEHGPEIGFVLHHLARDVTRAIIPNDRDALLARALQHHAHWVPFPQPRFKITGHALHRFIERVRPDLSEAEAWREMVALAADAPFARRAPEWASYLLSRRKIRGGYLSVGDGVCFAISDGRIKTVLTRRLVKTNPPGPDPFPDAGAEREDPAWPDRRYVAGETGNIECRTLLDGELLIGHGRSTYAAWLDLRAHFHTRGDHGRFAQGQTVYRQRRRTWVSGSSPAVAA